MSTDYVSSSEGMQLLNVDRSTFFYHVEKGDIDIQEGEDTAPRHRTYSVSDILKVKEYRKSKRMARANRMRDTTSFTLDWMYARDLPAALDLDYQVFDKRIIASIDTYETWLLKNPHIAMCAYDRKDRHKMLAYVGMIPLPEQVIMQVVTGQRDEMDIRADEIQTYDSPGEYVLLANSAVTHPTRPDLLYPVLSKIMQFWLEQYPTRFISRIYAQAASQAGDILISKLYLAPLYQIEQSTARVVKDAYVLDLSRPGASKVIRHFQQQLEEKRAQQELPEVTQPPLPTIEVETRAPRARATLTQRVTSSRPEGTITLAELATLLDRSTGTLKGHFKKWKEKPEAYPELEHIEVEIDSTGAYNHYFTPEQVERIRAYIERVTRGKK